MSAAAAASAALQEHFVRGPVLTDAASLGTVDDSGDSGDDDGRTTAQSSHPKHSQQQQQQQQQQGRKKKKKGRNKNKNKREGGVDEAWCRAVHARLKRFLAGGDGAVPFELLGPLAGRAQQRFAVALCRDVYRVPCRVVTLGRDTFVSATRPRDERPGAGPEVGLARRVAQLVLTDDDSPGSGGDGTAAPHGRALLGRAATEDAVRALGTAGRGGAHGEDGAGRACWGAAEVVAADAAPLWEGARDNVGLQLLERMGWTRGTGLGRAAQGAVEPLCAVTKPDRRGVGAEPAQPRGGRGRGPSGRGAHTRAPARTHERPHGTAREWQRERGRERDEKAARW